MMHNIMVALLCAAFIALTVVAVLAIMGGAIGIVAGMVVIAAGWIIGWGG